MTYTAIAGGGNWSDPATWGGTGIQYPHAGDTAIIDGSVGNGDITIDVASACAVITVQNGYTGNLIMNAGMTTTSNITLLAGMTFTPNTQIWTIGGNCTIVSAGFSFYKVNVSVNSTITLSDNFNCTNLLSNTSGVNISFSGAHTIGAGSLTLTGTNTFTISGAVSVSGQISIQGNTTMSGAFSVQGATFTIGAFTLTIVSDWTITGNYAHTDNSVISGSGKNFNVGGNLAVGTNNQSGTATIVLNGTGTWSASSSGGIVSNNLTINTAGTITIGTNIYYGSGSGTNTLLYITGTVITTSSTLTINGGCQLNTAGISWNNFNPSNNAGGVNNSTLLSDLTCVNCGNSGYAGVNGAYNVNISGNLNIGGYYFQGTATLVMNGTGVWTCNDSSSICLIKLTINTAGTITISGTVYYAGTNNVLTYVAGTVTGGTFYFPSSWGSPVNFVGNLTLNNLTLSTGVTLILSSGNTVTISGTFTSNGSTGYSIYVRSSSAGVYANFNVTTCGTVAWTGATDIDSSGGTLINDSYGATVGFSHILNWIDTTLLITDNPIVLSETHDLQIQKFIDESIVLSDAIIAIPTKFEIEDETLILSDSIILKQPLEFIHNKISFVNKVIEYAHNKFSMLKSSFVNCTNKILFRNKGIYSCKNDFRMRGSWQVPANGGVQSLGKEYIKVYISTIEQTDIDIDSISITKGLNNAHTANLILGRAYDATAPNIESVIEIKYSNWTLFKGYITQITPADNPENIQLYCEDEMWKQNKTRVYFQVGHLPFGASPDQYYYKYISTALSTLGIGVGFGNFCPQTINCWGKAKAEAITDLITQSGNFGWYYKEDGTPNYWKANEGSIINLEAQEIGKNLNIYQVLNHSFKSEVSDIINRFRVQMGVFVNGLNQVYQSYDYQYFPYQPTPMWDASLEVIATPANGLAYGFNYRTPENEHLYNNVFKKYKLSNSSDLELSLSKWSDRYTPRVEVGGGGMGWVCNRKEGLQTDGFSIDYKKNGSITFNEPIYYKRLNEYGEVVAVRRAQIYVSLYKKKLHTTTNTPNPYPMWFYTGVMGSYGTINTGDLSLSGLSIQSGGRYKDEDGNYKYIPSWNDTEFASDFANWELSKNCDEKISGNINLTLDTVCFYNIDLSKRILIPGIINIPLNIINMTYNLSEFTVTLQLENARSYYRSASIQSRGEDYF